MGEKRKTTTSMSTCRLKTTTTLALVQKVPFGAAGNQWAQVITLRSNLDKILNGRSTAGKDTVQGRAANCHL